MTIFCLLLSGCEYSVVLETQSPPAPNLTGETLTVHFIDVGQADCALLECGGEYMLIDGGNKDDSQLVVSYLEQQGVESLNTVICTHAHEDHVGGLPAVLAVYPTATILSPTKTYSSNIFDKFMYYADQQGVEVEIPEPGAVYSLGDNETGATVTILGPTQSYAETNDTSIVCRVEFGSCSFLFTGDMEVAAENDMLDYWGEDFEWETDVLKIGHHGSNTSSGYRFLHEVSPTYGVISVGADNDYGHPHKEPMSRFRQAGMTLLRTDELGTVMVTTDGVDFFFTWDNQAALPENAEPAEEITFIGNKNSLKFHSEECANLPSEKNQVIFSTYEEALAAGYTPCGSCLG